MDTDAKPAVLVVEDEPLLLLAATDMVEDAGFEAVMAINADEAVRMLEMRGGDIRIVFTDIDMPGSMDGLKLAAAVRERWPRTRIIVTSGYRTPDVEALPTDALFVPKPYSERGVVQAMWQMAG